MTTDRIKEIQSKTAYPDSVSVQQALLQVWNECEQEQLRIANVSGSAFWSDDKVIDFVNWYIELHKLDFRYTLENRTIIESFKNGDNASKWHCH
jgi:hypothetical protein